MLASPILCDSYIVQKLKLITPLPYPPPLPQHTHTCSMFPIDRVINFGHQNPGKMVSYML